MHEPPALPLEGHESPEITPALGTQPAFPGHLVRKVLMVTACAVLLYSVAFVVADHRAVVASLQKLPPRSIVLSLVFASGSFLLRFARWQRYLQLLDLRVQLGDSALMYTCGLAMSISPGKAGELLKPVMLNQVTGASMARTVPILAAERITDAMALVLLASLGLMPSPLGIALVSATLVGCVIVACVFGSQRLGLWVIDQLSRLRWVTRHKTRLLHAHESLLTLCTPLRLVEGFSWSLAAWVVHSLCLYSLAHVFDGVALSIWHAFFIDSAPALVGALAMLPGGLGFTEASMTGALVAMGDGAITPAIAAAITLAVRVTTLWWAVSLGLTALGLWQLKHWR